MGCFPVDYCTHFSILYKSLIRCSCTTKTEPSAQNEKRASANMKVFFKDNPNEQTESSNLQTDGSALGKPGSNAKNPFYIQVESIASRWDYLKTIGGLLLLLVVVFLLFSRYRTPSSLTST